MDAISVVAVDDKKDASYATQFTGKLGSEEDMTDTGFMKELEAEPSSESSPERIRHLTHSGPSRNTESTLARHWLRADGPISAESGHWANLSAAIALSDIFLLDSPPRIYGLVFDLETEKSSE
ncbi:MAG: hypothetical protein Q9175_005042 [Cornicularia normoerica]